MGEDRGSNVGGRGTESAEPAPQHEDRREERRRELAARSLRERESVSGREEEGEGPRPSSEPVDPRLAGGP